MNPTGTIGIILLVAIALISYRGFNHQIFFDQYKFHVNEILVNKKYFRLISSGFLHVGWMHLIFNLFSLLVFSSNLEYLLGPLNLLVVYFTSLVGGNLLSLLIHKSDGSYSAVGASGAISGLIFSSIALMPNLPIGLFLIPLSLPAWLFGLIYVIFSIYGIRSSSDNIGHDAHLGGGLVGLVLTSALYPSLFLENIVTTLLIALPAIVFLYILIKKPALLLVDNFFVKNKEKYYSPDHIYNQRRAERQKQVDKILDKISSKGINSLTKEEKDFLENYNN